MNKTEKENVTQSLKKMFPSAYNVFVDENVKYCEISISVDDFQGTISQKLTENGIQFEMIDYWDSYPFKYVFSYRYPHPIFAA